MADKEPEAGRRPGLRTARMEAFSDGVFAIAITLLVLELGVEAGAEGDLLKALADQWPSYVAYLVSFSTIGAIWIKHTVITEYLDSATAVLIRLNLLLLMVVSFLPFPTGLVAEHIDVQDAERVATTVYGMNLLLASFLLGALWRYAVRERLIRADTSDAELTTLSKQFVPSLAGYVVMMVVGLFVPLLAVLGYLAIAVYIILPVHAIWRRRSRS
ncbi:TMEM175 family protein [Mycolicibacterium elephantis]|uniref:TMEM175 family protein n=1 Tax=Mycolicibacterium elephantis TaxID=81858 RepID=UPI0007EADACF|nr:TMEM175 family protein [Mycolicibacterium elephantis]OBA83291.1 hypothetical protein A5633_01345 [Mycolicibacterium elephantis]